MEVRVPYHGLKHSVNGGIFLHQSTGGPQAAGKRRRDRELLRLRNNQNRLRFFSVMPGGRGLGSVRIGSHEAVETRANFFKVNAEGLWDNGAGKTAARRGQ